MKICESWPKDEEETRDIGLERGGGKDTSMTVEGSLEVRFLRRTPEAFDDASPLSPDGPLDRPKSEAIMDRLELVGEGGEGSSETSSMSAERARWGFFNKEQPRCLSKQGEHREPGGRSSRVTQARLPLVHASHYQRSQ